MTSNVTVTHELTEEEMNQTSAPVGLAIAAVVTGAVVTFASMKFMKWNDARKAQKNTDTED